MGSKFQRRASHLALCVAALLSTTAAADDAQQRLIDAGREQFVRVREHSTKARGTTENVDRFFNARSCAECHKLGGLGGAGTNEHNVQLVSQRFPAVVPISGDDAPPIQIPTLETRLRPVPLRTSNVPQKEHERNTSLAGFTPVGTERSRILHRRSSLSGYDIWRRALLSELARAVPAYRPEGNIVLPILAVPIAPRITELTGAESPRIESSERQDVSGDTEENAADILNQVAAQSRVITGSAGVIETDRWFQVEERNTPALFGLGLIDSIPQAEIDRIAAAQPPKLRGVSPRLRTGGRGRFGWKAQNATLADFNEGACAAELGLRTEKFTPSEWVEFRRRSTSLQVKPLSQLPAIDMTRDDLAALNAYVASLPSPKQIIGSGEHHDVEQGKSHFHKSGCAVCHVPDVGGVVGIYSDLLLHDSGTSSAAAYYGSPIGPPPENFDLVRDVHIRTPPLWGVADSAPYLHDGSAATLEEAILGHQGQALTAAENYHLRLTAEEQRQLLTFLRSLRAPQAVAVK